MDKATTKNKKSQSNIKNKVNEIANIYNFFSDNIVVESINDDADFLLKQLRNTEDYLNKKDEKNELVHQSILKLQEQLCEHLKSKHEEYIRLRKCIKDPMSTDIDKLFKLLSKNKATVNQVKNWVYYELSVLLTKDGQKKDQIIDWKNINSCLNNFPLFKQSLRPINTTFNSSTFDIKAAQACIKRWKVFVEKNSLELSLLGKFDLGMIKSIRNYEITIEE